MDSEYVDVADPQSRFEAVGHGIGIIIAAFIVGLTLGIASIFVLSPFVGIRSPDGSATPVASAVSAIFQFLGFILTVVAYLRWRDDRTLIDVRTPSLKDVGLIVGGFLGIVVLSMVLGVVIRFFGLETAQNSVITTGQENPEFFLYMIPITLLLVGPGEELVFRGVVQGLFERAYGPVPAIAIASVLFGLAHYFALVGTGGEGKLVYIAIAAILGVVLGIIYELSDNIVVPAVTHGIWNSFLFIGQWIAATYDIQQLSTIGLF